ncbi:hypothetical protein [Pseudescherichia sp.]|uniref:hypothetical protein n=1 Tax=Pseudescherichia sp. TaxID=2055881 RepID=UPI0028A67F96|nr:hypothetical protein [Pseudescherichia sp.]
MFSSFYRNAGGNAAFYFRHKYLMKTNQERGRLSTKFYVPRYDTVELMAVLAELQEVIEDSSEITMTLQYDEDDVLHVGYSTSSDTEFMEGLVLLKLPNYKWVNSL